MTDDTTSISPGAADRLGASASRGAAVTFGAQGLRIAIQVAGIVVLARLLSPEDYGLVAMILAVVGVADVIRDFGLGQAAVQAERITDRQMSNLFWINTAIGLALTGVAVALSGAVAALYDKPELQPLTAALAVCFAIRGATVQFTANLSRSLRFGRLAAAEITGQVIGLGAAIALAVAGMGAWALAWQQIAQVLAVLVLCAAFARWRPRGYDRTAAVRPFVGFGGALAASHLLNYASRNVDSVVLGMRLGASTLGLYNRAFQLVTMPLTQLQAPATRVALPVLSRLQSTRERFARFLLTGQFLLLAVIGLLTSVCVSQSDAVIRLALGADWMGAAPIFRVLAAGGAFQAVTYAAYWVFLAKGLVRQNLVYALVTRPLAIAMIVVGAQWGVLGVAWAYTASLALFWPVSLGWLWRTSDAPVGPMLREGLQGIAVLAVATTAASFATVLFETASWEGGDAAALAILVGTAVTLVVAGLGVLVLPALRVRAREALGLVRHFRRGAGGVPGPRHPISTTIEGD